MATCELNERPTVAPAVQSVLDGVRWRIRQYVWLEGLGGAAVWLGMAFWMTLLVDWLFEPRPFVRGLMLSAVLAILVGIVWQLIGRCALVRITDSNAATILERRFPQLDDSLLTAVVLGSDDRSEVDHRMLAETCRQAASRLANVEVRRVFNPRPLWSKCGAGGLLAVSVMAFAFLANDAFALWARRTLTLSDETWPRSTHLAVEGFDSGVRKVARGSDVEVIAKADTRMPQVPQVVEVRYRTDGAGNGRATMERRGVARGPDDRFQEYAYTFRSVLGDIHFDVAGGDDCVRDCWLQVVDSPTISAMTLDCQLPAYIGRKQSHLPVSGVMQIPAGSRVIVQALANKELDRIEVSRVANDRRTPLRTIARSELAPDQRGFIYDLGVLATDTTLLLSLTDTDGITSREPVRLALVAAPDQPPQIGAQLDGIGAAVTPQARIPVAGRISDDYGLGRIWFEYTAGQNKVGSHTIRQFTDHPLECTLADAALEVRELGMAKGQRLLVSVKAADLCDLGHGPNVASGEQWTLDVVTPEQLRVILDARELVLRQRFEAAVQEMTDTRDLLARLVFRPAAAAPRAKGSEPDDEPEDSPARQSTLRHLGVQGALTNCRKSARRCSASPTHSMTSANN